MHIEKRVPLAPLTTFGIGGKARYFCRVRNEQELERAFEFVDKNNIPFWILGGGSNVLVSDKGFPGLVVKIEILGMEFGETKTDVRVVAGAGESWDELVRLCVEKELYGLENLSGIPGTVGAAPVQNIGAYGVEIADFISWVEVFDTKKRSVRRLTAKQCRFGYRDSIFKQDGVSLVVLRVAFKLSKSKRLNLSYADVKAYFEKNGKTAPTLAEVRSVVLEIRSRKFPDLEVVGTAGSFFKNPVVSRAVYNALSKRYPGLPGYRAAKGKMKLSLAWIIDRVCNLKDLRWGETGVAPNQTLVLCNFGNATALEVQKLAAHITDTVRNATGILIEPEVRIVPNETLRH